MQNLVHLLSSLEVGGKERVVLDLARNARARGLDHRLLLFDHPYRRDARDFDPGEVPWEFLPREAGLDLAFVLRLARRLRGVDIVHAHNDTAIAYAGLARAWSLGRFPAIVGTFHGRPGHDTRAARCTTRWATRRARAVTAVAPELARELVELGWSRPCEVVWNGVDLERYAVAGSATEPGQRPWREVWGVPAGQLVLGHIGRFDPIKRQADLLKAARILWKGGGGPHVVFVGEGPQRARFEAQVGREPRVHVVDRVFDVGGFLRALDVFVLCSAHEAAPRALLEAMACGRACVATAVGGVPGLLSGGAGRLVPGADPAALAAEIGALLADPAARADLGRAARARAADFSTARQWQAYACLWEGITTSTSAGSASAS